MFKKIFLFSLVASTTLNVASNTINDVSDTITPYARTDCPSAKVNQIQLEGKKILYRQVNAPWRTLGYLGKSDGTEERYAALLAAKMADRDVVVGYKADNYDCGVTNYGTSSYVLRVY